MKRLSAVILFPLLALVAACSTVPETITQQPLARQPMPAATPAANGAIYNAGFRPMFEDRRARRVGDMLTIAINERTSAGKSAANATSKSGDVEFGASKLLGIPAATAAKLGLDVESGNKFEDKGTSSSSNTFSGTITVTVMEVLPNGNLLVSGEKQVALDKGVEYVRFSGVVNPDNVMSGNVVSSTQVADARVEYRTNTRVDKAELMSQLARFFLSVMPL